MGLLDRLTGLFGGDDGATDLGTVARSYVETGGPPDEEWLAAEGPDGELAVVVVVGTTPGERATEADVESVGRDVRSLGGEVVHVGPGGVVLARLHKSRLRTLAENDRITRLEVTRDHDAG